MQRHIQLMPRLQNTQRPSVRQQSYEIQQPQMMQNPQVIYQRHHVQCGCCGSYPRLLSDKMYAINFNLGICMLILGIATFAFGITGLFMVRARIYHSHYVVTYYNILSVIAPNIWAALFVSYQFLDQFVFMLNTYTSRTYQLVFIILLPISVYVFHTYEFMPELSCSFRSNTASKITSISLRVSTTL